MSAYPYLPLFTRDFIADTTHLEATETGAYLLLMMHAWQSPDCSLPDDDRRLAAWARVDTPTWQRIKSAVMEFWTLAGGHWTQKRLSTEWQRTQKVRAKQRANIMRRWHPERAYDGNTVVTPSNLDTMVLPRKNGGNTNVIPPGSKKEIGIEEGSTSEVGGTRVRARARGALAAWDGDDA